MDKRDNPLFSYAYLDSQRLKDTFFSPPKNKRKKKTRKLGLILLGAVAILILTAAAILSVKYDFMVIARRTPDQFKDTISLLSNGAIGQVSCLNQDERLMKKENSFIYLTIAKEPVAISFELKKSIDLRSNSLYLYLKKSEAPLNIGVVVKDGRFFSNSLNPAMVTVTQKGSSFIKVPISFAAANLQNANLYQIKQITLYFYPQDKENINWALIKDLILI